MKKMKFWIPIGGLFCVIPGEKNFLDGDFFKYPIMYIPFLLWHMSWIVLPLMLLLYG